QKRGWITIGYARKSKTNETQEKRSKLLQKMVNTLHTKDVCEHVYASAYSEASSNLKTRD
ncbi:hypothetical protein DM01DRAFT_247329, partial [Hesseltinella vesiculosa]